MSTNLLLYVQYLLISLAAHLQCCTNNQVAYSEAVRRELIVAQVEAHDAGEYAHHGVVTEHIHTADVEVPCKAGCDRIPSPTRWAHCRDELKVN